MTKNLLFAAALLSLALMSGCATGGSGPCAVNCASIELTATGNGISPVDQAPISESITFTASFKNTSTTSVNWSLSGTSCSGSDTSSSNPCGYFSATTGTTATYQAPSKVPSSNDVTVIATSTSDSGLQGSDDVTIVDITTSVAPVSPNVGVGLSQQFSAIATPDNAFQTFTWTCTANGASCANFTWTPSHNNSPNGTATYTPTTGEKCASSGCVQISAQALGDPNECANNPKACTSAEPVIVTSRVSGTYAFRFSGYDNGGSAVLVAGTFTVASGGSISGVEDELTSSGPNKGIAITGGSYNPTSSNNSGMLTLTTGTYPNTYRVVLDGAGNIQMVESDGHGSGSGVAEPVTSSNKFNTSQTFAFGFTGVDSSTHRVGYAGLIPMDGSGNVTGGMADINDNGSSSNICSSPCTVSGTYTYNTSTNAGSFVLSIGGVSQHFDFFAADGSGSANDLTLYAISTDALDATHPAVAGTMAIQNPKTTYNNKAFSGASVSVLTGANGNVALTLGATDGSSSGTGGTGHFNGTFDWNNNGTIVSVPPLPAPCASPKVCSFTYAYGTAPSSATNGRYTFQMLGDPNATPTAVAPLNVILYATGGNRGFLLDQSSSAVMTGTMTAPQPPKGNGGFFANATMTGTYAVATYSNSLSNTANCTGLTSCDATMNLLLTSPGGAVFNATGTENPGNQPVSWTYDVQTSGLGTLSPISPATTPTYDFYAITGTEFYLIEIDPGIPSPILFMAQ